MPVKTTTTQTTQTTMINETKTEETRQTHSEAVTQGMYKYWSEKHRQQRDDAIESSVPKSAHNQWMTKKNNEIAEKDRQIEELKQQIEDLKNSR